MTAFNFDTSINSFTEFLSIYKEKFSHKNNVNIPDLELLENELNKENSEINYVLLHFHHPAFQNQSRKYFLFPSQTLLKKLEEKIKLYSPNDIEPIEGKKVLQFYHFVHSVYFAILGRMDSISEQIYRKYSANKFHSESFFHFKISNEKESKISHNIEVGESSSKALFSLELSKSYFEKLGGKNSETSTLSELFYSVLIKVFCKETSNERNLESIIKDIESELVKLDFFHFKKSILTECVRQIYSNDEHFVVLQLLNAKYLVSDNPFKDSNKFRFISRILGILQALSIYAELFGGNFKLFTVGMGSSKETKLLSGFAFGYTNNSSKIGVYKASIQAVVNDVISQADMHYKGDEFSENSSKLYQLIKNDSTLFSEISSYYSNKEIHFASLFLQHLIESLSDSTHEGLPLRFNILLGQEAYLREVMNPIGSPYKNDELWEIKYTELNSYPKAVQRVAFKVLSIYSFLQNTSNFLCFSFGRESIEIRYIGGLNKIYESIMKVDHSNPLTVFPSVIKVAKTFKNLFYGFVNNDESYLAVGGGIISRYTNKEEWTQFAGANWVKDSLQSLPNAENLTSLFKINNDEDDAEFLLDRITNAISILSYTGHGTMVITGKYEEIKKYTTWSESDFYGQGLDYNDFIKNIERNEYFLYNMLIRDGGLMIDDSLKVYTRVFISPYEIDEEEPLKSKPFNPLTSLVTEEMTYAQSWQEDGDYEWKEYAKWYKWGTRHTNAASMSYLGKGESKVLTLSSDSEVHFFDGKKIYEIKRNDKKIR